MSSSKKPKKSTPRGAVLVTTFLALVILVFWFGMYVLNLVRG